MNRLKIVEEGRENIRVRIRNIIHISLLVWISSVGQNFIDNGPINTTCASFIEVSPGTAKIYSTETEAATVTAVASSIPNCGDDSNNISGPGVWFGIFGTGKFLALSTCGTNTNFNTQISMYNGTCSDLICVDSNDDSGGKCTNGVHSTMNLALEVDVLYYIYIYIHGFGTALGIFELTVTELSIPLNDSCEKSEKFMMGESIISTTSLTGLPSFSTCDDASADVTSAVWFSFPIFCSSEIFITPTCQTF